MHRDLVELLGAVLLAQWLGWVGLILSISISIRKNRLLIPLLAVLRMLVVD